MGMSTIKATPATKSQMAQQSPALEAMIQLLLWLSPTIEKFPRSHKFTLGDRIETTALDALERLIEATFTRDRRPILQRANLDFQKLRILLRVAHEMEHLDARRYEHVMRRIDEVGRLTGGWMKSDAGRNGGAVEPVRSAH